MTPRRQRSEFVAEDPAFVATLERARRFARINATVLITGESGTGKELAARYIHAHSPRAGGPFVPVNTGAIPENLLESELFGYLRGAFTGAQRDTPGLFAAANGGTLFLDEVGEMPLTMQAKLLRALQEREVRPVGARSAEPVDARVIAATNADLTARIARGAFREDLYFRLNVVGIELPPLRRRLRDIVPLAEIFVRAAAKRLGADAIPLSRGAREALLRYRWPGNVRELENAIEHAVALSAGGEIRRDDLPDAVLGRGPSVPRSPGERVEAGAAISLDAMIARHIAGVIASVGGNRARAAAILEVSPSTLWRREQRGDGATTGGHAGAAAEGAPRRRRAGAKRRDG